MTRDSLDRNLDFIILSIFRSAEMTDERRHLLPLRLVWNVMQLELASFMAHDFADNESLLYPHYTLNLLVLKVQEDKDE